MACQVLGESWKTLLVRNQRQRRQPENGDSDEEEDAVDGKESHQPITRSCQAADKQPEQQVRVRSIDVRSEDIRSAESIIIYTLGSS